MMDTAQVETKTVPCLVNYGIRLIIQFKRLDNTNDISIIIYSLILKMYVFRRNINPLNDGV